MSAAEPAFWHTSTPVMCAPAHWRNAPLQAILCDMYAVPEVRFTRSARGWVAYTVEGSGPLDIVFVSSLMSHVEVMSEPAPFQDLFGRFASFGRLIRFDRRGTGLSDPVDGGGVGSVDDWSEDMLAVLDATKARDVCLWCTDTGATCALVFAATHPERVRSVVLVEPWVPYSGDLSGDDVAEAFAASVDNGWGEVADDTLSLVNPVAARDANAAVYWARFARMSMNRKTAAQAFRDFLHLDIREAVPLVQAPVLVAHRTDNLSTAWLLEHLQKVATCSVEHSDMHWWWTDADLRRQMIDVAEEHFTGQRPPASPVRVLATVLFTDIVSSTERAATVGDGPWRELLDIHDAVVRQEIQAHGGQFVKSTGDGILATFDMPARAIQCGANLRRRLHALDLHVRIGLHAGEIERRGEDLAGVAVHIAARIMALGDDNDILVSRTVRDLVVGSGLTFADFGTHELKGVPDAWQVFRFAS